MNWPKLLNADRLCGPKDMPGEYRSPFQRDYDRIVFTTAFRRLQDKTQVFPLSSSDYVRTRLTHSIEVSCVARNLGTVIGRRLRKMKEDLGQASASDMGSIVAAAALAHDLGNPPFGHSGEAAIQHWFKESKVAEELRKKLTHEEAIEFEQYEGNAHAFRLVTRLLTPTNEGGLQLTFATLATLLKYPIRAHAQDDRFKDKVSAKKYNYFEREREYFDEVVTAVGLVQRSSEFNWWCRHPLCFVCEAADDITNRIVDFEDGVRLGCINGQKAKELLLKVLKDPERRKFALRMNDDKERIGYLRAVVISQLAQEAIDAFFAHYDEIMAGTFEADLYSRLESFEELKPIKDMTARCVYTDNRVLGVETAGFEIIYQLLERFSAAALDELKANSSKGGRMSTKSEKILGLLPKQYRLNRGQPIKRRYFLLLAITDFVAGMTDSYAVETFQRITGQKFVT